MNRSSSIHVWPATIIGFFVIFISGLASFIFFASTHPMDLVHPNYYEDELRYQQHLDQINRTRHLTGQVALNYIPAQRAVLIQLPADHARRHPTGEIRFYRPSNAALDYSLALSVTPSGAQQIDTKNLLPGLWKLRIHWIVSGEQFFFEQSVILRSPPDRDRSLGRSSPISPSNPSRIKNQSPPFTASFP